MILPPMPTDDDDIHDIYCRVSGQTDRTKRIERFWIIDREKEMTITGITFTILAAH